MVSGACTVELAGGQHPESWRLLWVGQEEGGVRADSLPLPKPGKEGRGHTSLSEGLPFPPALSFWPRNQVPRP